MGEEIEPGIGDIPEEGIYGISPTLDGDLLEVNWVAPQKGGGITRRQFVVGASAAGGLLVLTGCVPATETPPTATRTPEEVGLPPTPTLEIKETYTSTLESSPTATKEPTATATSEPATPTPEPAPPTPEQATPTPVEATPTPEEPIVYVTVQRITSYSSPEEEHGYILSGKKFTILKEENGWLYIRLEAGAEAWIQASETAYYPEGEVPPPTATPEKPPAAVCTEPHWKERTPDRKTGYIIEFGTPTQKIFPDKPYAVQYFREYIGGPWYTMRHARITTIDKQNQIITFQLNDGSTRQRKFTQNTIVIRDAHEIYQGMPAREGRQSGGNLCDLEMGDVASILHPSEPESANPNPGLTDLWGVFIVQ